MLTKILIFLAVVIGVFVVARMGASSAMEPLLKRKPKQDRVSKRARKAEDLKQCRVCGAWSPTGEGCPCGEAPTP
ncbi:MAG: hypothetical protein AAF367_20065 [Pseudomonadota bacterium]